MVFYFCPENNAMIKKLILFVSIIIASGLLITNIYTSIVDATSWGSNIPVSIESARNYFGVVNPGTFFRVFSPLSQALALLSLIVFWKSVPSSRKFLGIALACYVVTDAFTFAYFYPRNDIMFINAPMNVEAIKQAWSQWDSMNWVRSLLIAFGVCFSCLGLNNIYTRNS
jgi:hypothetical protein